MLKYVHEAKDLYYNKKEINTEQFITCVWEGSKGHARKEHVVETATRVFLRLYQEGNCLPVRGKEILKQAGLANYTESNSHGLWPWLKKNGNADVIKQGKNDHGETVYYTTDDFYVALQKVCR